MAAAFNLAPPKPLPIVHVGARIRYNPARARRLRYRRFHRTRLPVTVLTVVGPHLAVVRGITLFGACLKGGRKMRRREMVALRLPSGYRVTARVRWRLGAWVGVMFAAPVADFARLISEGALVQSSLKRRRTRSEPPVLNFKPPEGAVDRPGGEIGGLREAVAEAWRVIERALSARAAKRKSVARRFGGF